MDVDRAMNLIFAVHGGVLVLFALVVVGVLAVLLAITAVRVFLNTRRLARCQIELERSRLDPTGQPYPPSSRGLCSHCGMVYSTVHFLTNGTPLCRTCYDQHVSTKSLTPAKPRVSQPSHAAR